MKRIASKGENRAIFAGNLSIENTNRFVTKRKEEKKKGNLIKMDYFLVPS